MCSLPKPPAGRALSEGKEAPQAAFPSWCFPAQTKRRTEAERTFLHMGRTMKEDLEAVVERLKPLFPADIRVVAAYAESYHAEFASQLSALTQFELCPRDTYMLLLWVQNLYPK